MIKALCVWAFQALFVYPVMGAASLPSPVLTVNIPNEQEKLAKLGAVPLCGTENVIVLNPPPYKELQIIAPNGFKLLWVDDGARQSYLLSSASKYSPWRERVWIIKFIFDFSGLNSPTKRGEHIFRWGLPTVLDYRLNVPSAVIKWAHRDTLQSDISPKLTVRSRRKEIIRKQGRLESFSQKPQAESAYYNPRTGHYEHPKGPLGHLPLSVKVLLFPPLFAFGFWVSRRGWNAKRSGPGFALFVLGGTVITTAVIQMIV